MAIATHVAALLFLFLCPVAGAARAQPTPVVTPPRLLDFVEAEYPAAAAAAGIEGAVELELTIAADGAVTEANVVTPAGQGFDEAALAAVRRFRFEPARRNDEAVAARIRYRYVFELRVQAPPPPAPEQPAPPPPPGQLEGRVLVASDGDPIGDAEVLLASQDGAVTRRAVTGRDGAFRFDDLPPDEYTITVIAAELGDMQYVETIEPGELTTVVYRLDVLEDPNTFGAVAIVDAPPREVTRRTITREELTRVPGTRGDALRTVELLPGVGRPAFGGGQLIVRGSAPGDSEVYLDSAPVPLLYHFGGLTSFFNSRLLERIDFYPGNFSARFGRKLGGVLDVGSRDPATDGLHGVLDLNIIDASLLIEAPLGERASFAVGARRSYIDFFFENIVPADAFDVVAAPVYYDYQLIGTWRPTDRDRLRLLFYGSSDEFAIILSDPADGDPAIRGDLSFSTEFHKVFVGWTRQLTADLDQDLQVLVGPTRLDFALGEDLSFDATFWGINTRAEWRLRLSPRVRVIGGLDMLVAPVDIAFRGPPVPQTEGNPGGNPLSSQEVSDVIIEAVAYRPAAYIESDLRPIDPLRLVLGLRLDWYDEIRQWSFDPRAVAILSLTDHDRIKGGVGLFSQPPEFQESDVSLGNPNLLPARAVHVGFGYERDLADGISVGVEGFLKYIWSRVVSTEGGLPPRFTNGGIGRIYGLEVSGRVQPAGRRWFGFLSYTLSRSERRDGDAQDWRLFDFDQTHIFSLAAVYRLGRGWELGGTLRLVSGNPETPITGGLYDANSDLWRPVFGDVNSRRGSLFHRLDVRVEKLWTFTDWKLALYLDVQNVYNSTNAEGAIYNYDYTESEQIPGLPIIPSLGIRGEL